MQRLAEDVGLRRASVHARVRRLESEGFVRGYRADLDPSMVGAGLVAFVFLRVSHGKGSDCLAGCSRVGDSLRAMPEVLECHTLAGDVDLVVKVRVADVAALEKLVLSAISGLPSVEQVRTSVALSTQIERAVEVPPARRARRGPQAGASRLTSSG